MPKQTPTGPVILCDLVKLLRSQWLSRPQIAKELGVHENTCRTWVAELTANGMLREMQAERRDQPGAGRTPMIYSLSPEWGGQAGAAAGQGEGNGNG